MLERENGAYWDTLGWILFRQGDASGARERIEKSIALSPKSAEVWEHYGDVLIALGEKEPARRAYERALELEPERQQVKAKLLKLIPQEEKN